MARAKVGEITLEWAARGDPARPPIVLIRGLGTQMTGWPESLLAGLAGLGLYVVTFDNRDVGLSTWLDHLPTDRVSYTISDMARDVVGLLDAIGAARAHVLGISMGGMIAQHVAFDYPDRVLSLVSVMSGSGNPDLPRADQRVMARLRSSPPSDAPEDIIRFIAESEGYWESPAWPVPLDERIAAARAAYERAYHPAGEARQMQAVLADGSRVERLGRIRAPTLVIHGRDDALVPLAAGEDTARCIPGARFEVIDGMGHNLPEGAVPVLLDLIGAHLASL